MILICSPMPKAVKSLIIAAVVVAVGATFALLSAATPREGLSLLDVLIAKLWHLALFLFFWLAVYAVGRGCEKLIAGRVTWPPDLALALGIVAFVVLGFGVCAAGVAYGWVAKAFVIGAAVAGVVFMRLEYGRVPARVKRWLEELEVSSGALVVGAGALALSVSLVAAEPPYFWDALTYHLAVPKAYADAHGFVYLPYNVFSSMPLGASLFYLWPYLWDGLITANGSHLVATILALTLTYRLARRWLSQFYAVLAAAFVVLTPVVHAVMGGAHVEHFSILFVVAALFAYVGREGGAGRLGKRRAVVVGIFLGAALAVKYTSYPAFVAFVPIWVYDIIKRRTRAGEVAITVGVAFLLVVPWLAKAYVERGNPAFPLLYDVFGGRDFDAGQAARLISWQASMGRGRSVVDLLLVPYRISVEAGFRYEDFCGIYLPFLLPLAAIGVGAFRRAGRVVAFGWVYLLAWALGPQQLRFLGGALPAFGIAAAGTLAAVEPSQYRRVVGLWRAFVVVAVLALGLSYNAGSILDTLPGHRYLFWMDREAFLSRRCPFYPAQSFINRELPGDAKVLMLFTNEILYLERPAVYDSFLEASAFLLAAEKAGDVGELYRFARERGVTHVHVYHFYEGRVWPSYSTHAREVTYDFVQRYGVVVYEDEYNDVYELVSAVGEDVG